MQLVLLRLFQGMFTGTVSASQVLIASQAPPHRSGLALGGLSSAVYTGAMAGVFMGGLYADLFGYRSAFIAAGCMPLLAGSLILFGVKEVFTPPEPRGWLAPAQVREAWGHVSAVMPLLAIIGCIALVRQFDMAMFPLLIQDIHGSLDGVSVWTGILGAVAGVAGLLSGILMGRWADRLSIPALGRVSALGAGLSMLPQGLARSFVLLFPARFSMVFFSGGLDPVIQTWLAKVTPPHQQGLLFGWASSVRATGWMLAALLSGAIAATHGIRMVFYLGCGMYLCLLPLIGFAGRKVAQAPAEKRHESSSA
jgi:DHA1 family multidrug resistance protein-like MFS transporter